VLQRPIDGLPPLGPATGTAGETIRDRWRMLAAVDEGVGELLVALEQTGALDATVFVATSDHGYWYGEHGLSVERRLAYEEGIRIPLLVRYPPLVRPGRLIDALALSIDLAPTLLELAGVAGEHPVDGRSLAPLLRGESPPDWRTSFLIEYFSDSVFPRVRNMGYQAVRTEQYKLIRYTELDGMDELYDLRADPYELVNVIDQPAFQETLRALQGELARLAATGAPGRNQ
jgi:N-acetylglucosamine-6-sulfatase